MGLFAALVANVGAQDAFPSKCALPGIKKGSDAHKLVVNSEEGMAVFDGTVTHKQPAASEAFDAKMAKAKMKVDWALHGVRVGSVVTVIAPSDGPSRVALEVGKHYRMLALKDHTGTWLTWSDIAYNTAEGPGCSQ